MQRPLIAFVYLMFLVAVIIFQSRHLEQYTQYTADVILSVDQEQWHTQLQTTSRSFSFSQVFGGNSEGDINRGNTTSTANDILLEANPDSPPPVDSWLLNKHTLPPPITTLGGSIPRIINKIYFQRESGYPNADSMPPKLKAAHESWVEMNPGFELRYFDLYQAREYLRQHYHPVFLRAFDCLPAFASKSDLFRMCLLYREGGWHSDWKQLCLKKLILQNITEMTDIFAAYDMWNSTHVFTHRCVQNALIGSKPQHPIIETMLYMLLQNVRSSPYTKTALDATSTCLFGRAVAESEKDRNSQWFNQIAGKFVHDLGGSFSWGGQVIVQHKCDGCGASEKRNQDWGDAGNDYIMLYKEKNFYCQDAASLFRTTTGSSGNS